MLPGAFYNVRRPDQIISSRIAEMHGLHHRCLRFRQMVVNRNDLMTAAALQRAGTIVFIEQKILERSQQERAKPAFFLVRPAQRVLLEHVSEKSLDEVLC